MTPALYSPEELGSRPIEHTIEQLNCVELGVKIGCSRSFAWDVIRGERELSPEEIDRLRDWTASCAAQPRIIEKATAFRRIVRQGDFRFVEQLASCARDGMVRDRSRRVLAAVEV